MFCYSSNNSSVSSLVVCKLECPPSTQSGHFLLSELLKARQPTRAPSYFPTMNKLSFDLIANWALQIVRHHNWASGGPTDLFQYSREIHNWTSLSFNNAS